MGNNTEKNISITDSLCLNIENVCLAAQSHPMFFWPMALLSIGFSKQECWSGLPSPSPRNFPDPATDQVSCTTRGFFTIWATREAIVNQLYCEWTKIMFFLNLLVEHHHNKQSCSKLYFQKSKTNLKIVAMVMRKPPNLFCQSFQHCPKNMEYN